MMGVYGTNGRVNDGGVWSKSKILTLIEDSKIGIPQSKLLPDSEGKVPSVFLGDDAFALKLYLLKRYSLQGLTKSESSTTSLIDKKNIRKSVWNFGESLAHLSHCCYVGSTRCYNIILTILAFHNMLCNSPDKFAYCPHGLVDSESSDGDIIYG